MSISKLPWTAIKPLKAPYCGIQCSGPSVTVAGTSSGLSQADAAFIVDACNDHDALVSACSALCAGFESGKTDSKLHASVRALLDSVNQKAAKR